MIERLETGLMHRVIGLQSLRRRCSFPCISFPTYVRTRGRTGARNPVYPRSNVPSGRSAQGPRRLEVQDILEKSSHGYR